MEQVKKYRKKLNVIEAIQYTGENIGEIKAFVGDDFCDKAKDLNSETTTQAGFYGTFEGKKFMVGDFIIRGAQGKYYTCEPDMFNMIYNEEPED